MKLSQNNILLLPTMESSYKKIHLWLVVIIFLLSACTGSTKDKQSRSNGEDISFANTNPCTMLTSEEVDSIFGEAATADSDPTTQGPIRSCSFHSDSGGNFFLIQLGPVETLKVDTGDPDVIVIEGLGDEAIFSYGMLRVRVDESVLQITTWHSSSKQAEALTFAQDVARIALDHLP